MIRFVHLSSISSGQIAPASVTLWSVTINTGVASTLKLYNDTSAVVANLVASIDCGNIATLWYGVYCPKGLFYDLSVGAPDITIGYE